MNATSAIAATTAATVAASAQSDRTATTPDDPGVMRAVVQRRYGNSSVLEVAEVERPAVAADEVLIEVRAAAIDRGTEHLMTGRPWLIRLAGFGLLRPKQPVIGLDVAGVVRQVGAEVTRFSVGDEVFGIASGSVAQFAAAKEKKLSLKPANITFEQAAASTVSGITALQALTDVGELEAGQRVLVIGASGGVGTFAVQLARSLGGVVDGVAGAKNRELVRSLGAEAVYDYRTTDVADIEQRYDLIIDIGGRNPVRKLRRLLTDSGTLVLVGGENGNRVTGGVGRQIRAAAVSPFVAHRLVMMISAEDHSLIDRLATHLAANAVTPAISGRFKLDEAIDAMAQLERGQAGGKLVIEVADGGPSHGDTPEGRRAQMVR
jgi:NADPH:quinone reductase-like Zn-dependent oxidoreductase